MEIERGDVVDEVPEHLRRYPTRSGREALAARLGLTIDPFSQDWEWEVADPLYFLSWLMVYRRNTLSDDERFSLMEMLVQCVEDSRWSGPIEAWPEWQSVAALLRTNPRLHASTIGYWSVLGADDPEEHFRVSHLMRRVWAEVQPHLTDPSADGPHGVMPAHDDPRPG